MDVYQFWISETTWCPAIHVACREEEELSDLYGLEVIHCGVFV